MVNKNIWFALVFLLLTQGCSKIFNDDKLLLKQRPYYGNRLRLDGYYYSEFQSDKPRYSIYFFYENGVLFRGNNPYVSEIEAEENFMKNGKYYNSLKNLKFQWGTYQIADGKIRFEHWYPSERPYKSYLSIGDILNDTTFRVTQKSDSDGSNVDKIDELYHFKALSPKPDSTNNFVN